MAEEIAVLAGGCFWCTEAVFQMLRGVTRVDPGYTGGTLENPTSEQVYRNDTGHVEVARVEYDPSKIRYRDLMTVFFGSHDATQVDGQGYDRGPLYRSVIFYTTPEQKREAEAMIAELNASAKEGKPVITTVEPLTTFYPAEEYHKDFYKKGTMRKDYCELIIAPKLQKVQKQFADLLASHPHNEPA